MMARSSMPVGSLVSARLMTLLISTLLVGFVAGAPPDAWVRASPERVYASLLALPGVAELDPETQQALLAPYVDIYDLWDVCEEGITVPDENERVQNPEPVEGCITMWASYPTNYSADTPVIVLAHGANRDPWGYVGAFIGLGDWNVFAAAEYNLTLQSDSSNLSDDQTLLLQAMERSAFPPTGENIAEQAILLSPQFDKLNCPAYGQGGVSSRDGKMFKKESWDFKWISIAFSSLVDRQSLTTQEYSLYGYSQGAQFVHRLLLLADEDPRLTWVLTGAPAFWTFASNDQYPEAKYPFGLANPTLQFAKDRMGNTLKRRHTIMVGEYDTVSDGIIRRGDIVDQQGINRLERATNFFGNATACVTNPEGTALDNSNWDFYITPNAGHMDMLLVMQQAIVEVGFPFHPERALHKKDGTNSKYNDNQAKESTSQIDDPSGSGEAVAMDLTELADSSGNSPSTSTKFACWLGSSLLLSFTTVMIAAT